MLSNVCSRVEAVDEISVKVNTTRAKLKKLTKLVKFVDQES